MTGQYVWVNRSSFVRQYDSACNRVAGISIRLSRQVIFTGVYDQSASEHLVGAVRKRNRCVCQVDIQPAYFVQADISEIPGVAGLPRIVRPTVRSVMRGEVTDRRLEIRRFALAFLMDVESLHAGLYHGKAQDAAHLDPIRSVGDKADRTYGPSVRIDHARPSRWAGLGRADGLISAQDLVTI